MHTTKPAPQYSHCKTSQYKVLPVLSHICDNRPSYNINNIILQVLCAWDIFEHVLVQKITVKFPFSQRLPDHGPAVLHALQPTNSLCILCNEYIAEFKVGSVSSSSTAAAGSVNKQSVWSVTSHEHPLCAALYNAHFHQVSE